MHPSRIVFLALGTLLSLFMLANSSDGTDAVDTTRGDQLIAAYFRSETQKLANACLADVKTWHDFECRRETYRQQLREMLGLDPMPERTPLGAVVTGTLERDGFRVEKLYFQSRPHLYVTGTLYLPKNVTGKAPAILYLCGHSTVKKNGINYGAKAHYQYHGAWFAQNGYVCLVIDTLQLGEIEGIHHGTYRENMWWWNARGYTPAGVETWNSMRAIDYLISRPEVDPERLGVTGRSGGGAYSWYLTALDDRIKAAVPVAGITTLKNHVVDGGVEGHCDCMFVINTYRWDYPQLAALAAPRPLLISNTDRDKIFPFDGVVNVYQKVRGLYEPAGKGPDVALQMAAGPHEDLQVLQLYALQWFNKHLKHENPLIESAAKSYFQPEELKVFEQVPEDQLNTRIHETFVPLAPAPSVPESQAAWQTQRDKWMEALREKCFRGWPTDFNEKLSQTKHHAGEKFHLPGVHATAFEFVSQDDVPLLLYLLEPSSVPRKELKEIILQPLDDEGWARFSMAKHAGSNEDGSLQLKLPQAYPRNSWPDTSKLGGSALAFVAPRGVGPTAWTKESKKQIHIRRRFMLLGQTLDGMRVWDVRRAIQTLRAMDGLADVPVSLRADREMAGIALYAALFEPNIKRLELRDLPKSHREGPNFLNVLRFLDVPQTVAMAAENSQIQIEQNDDGGWEYPLAVAKKLGWDDRIEIRKTTADTNAAAGAASK
jgi:dienelactone hydrolase